MTNKIFIVALVFIALMVLAPLAAAATIPNQSMSRGVTAKGPSGLLVTLGIEEVVTPLEVALDLYLWISVLLVLLITTMASQRNTRFFLILIPIFSAIFAWFGWLDTGNDTQLWGLILVASLFGVALYMKDTNKEKWGSGGPGSTIVNLVIFMILLQSVVGFVNGAAIWNDNTGDIPDDKWQNVDLEEELPAMSNSGGLLEGLVTTVLAVLIMGIEILKVLMMIMLSIVAFSLVLYLSFPFLQVPLVTAFLVIVQVGIYILYALFIWQIFYKPTPDPGYF